MHGNRMQCWVGLAPRSLSSSCGKHQTLPNRQRPNRRSDRDQAWHSSAEICNHVSRLVLIMVTAWWRHGGIVTHAINCHTSVAFIRCLTCRPRSRIMAPLMAQTMWFGARVCRFYATITWRWVLGFCPLKMAFPPWATQWAKFYINTSEPVDRSYSNFEGNSSVWEYISKTWLYLNFA